MVLADYKGHTDDVTCSDLAPSGKYVVSCSEDCTVKVQCIRRTHLMVSVLISLCRCGIVARRQC